MKQPLTLLFLLFVIYEINAQDNMDTTNIHLPYYEIPEPPATYTAGTVTGRLIDGLGFRFYWATEGLRPEDVNYKPSENARTSLETIRHIERLTDIIHNSLTGTPTPASADVNELSYNELRGKILNRLAVSSEILKKSSDDDFYRYELIFKSENATSSYPFWNQINGPIADALWHVGQIVSFRRASGNPLNPKISVFNGTVRE